MQLISYFNFINKFKSKKIYSNLMELTKDNYYDIEPNILKDIEECNFIAFDLEMSGLIQNIFKIYDSPEENFIKSKYNAENFRIIQFGISFFIKSLNNDKEYIAKPYNIYVFPSEKQNNGKFDFYIESIIFNRDHGCDFNKWIKKGVPYLNDDNLNKLTERTLNGDINKYNPNDPNIGKNINLYKEKDKIIYEQFLNEFNSFFNDQNEKIFKHDKINKHLVLYFLNKLSEEIRNRIFIEYKEETNGHDTKEYIIIHKLTPEEKKVKIIEKNNEKVSLIKKEKGVKNIIEKIIESKKPIIGHNCFLDLTFIMSHFMEEIPKQYKEYKNKLKNKFKGGIYDTKLLYNASNLDFIGNKTEKNIKNNIHLECLYTNLKKENDKLEIDKKIKIEIPEGFIDYLDESNSSKFHQADYDSFTTGCSFIFMFNILGDKFIKEHENKINCYRGLYSCYDLNNDDIKEKYLNNCSDAFILSFNDETSKGKDLNIKENIINSHFVEVKLNSKELGNSYIVFINSENKNNFIEIINGYKNIIRIKTIEEFKKGLKSNIKNKSSSEDEFIHFI